MYKKIYKEWLNNVNEVEREELLSIKDNDDEIKERFSLELAFGTAGMRGTIGMGTYKMNQYTVKRATEGLARYIIENGKEAMERGVLISYDTRLYSMEFALDVANVLSAFGIKSYIYDSFRPVPMCSFAIRCLKTFAGVMITASHNPKEYNGYKVYGEDGAQMSPEATAVVVGYIKKVKSYFNVPSDNVSIEEYKNAKDGQKLNENITVIGESVDEKYYEILENLMLSKDIIKKRGKDIKLVYTPIHGSGYVPVTTMFNRLGISAHIVEEQKNPDTNFSTVSMPNPEKEDALLLGMALGDKVNADVVLGTDPDCDRMGVAIRNKEGKFELLTGNQIGVLILDYLLTRKEELKILPSNGAVIKTIVTSTIADRMAKKKGMTVFNVLTGFKFIGELMTEWAKTKEYEYIFGFEESYGSLVGTHARDKDAVIACLIFAELVLYLEEKGLTVFDRLEQIFEDFGYYTEKNISIEYKGLKGMDEMKDVMAKLRKQDISFVGTEKVLKVADYKTRKVKFADGSVEDITLPESDVIYLGLSNEQFVCIRPSGTEPKLKIYVLVFDKDKNLSQSKAEYVLAEAKKLL
ncbi:MAG TPA: phospho-sugar mutase [Clostridiales bacterium]|nr:phospho-sugar mutase [Clostridiales bacterium]